ncbi:MAG: zeta toxin family protein [Bacillota bacterium]|jgi:predicted ABC-type ATPase
MENQKADLVELQKYKEYFDRFLRNNTTEDLFSTDNSDGTHEYVKVRSVLHETIIDEILKDSIRSSEPVAVFMGGGSGSGKSRIRDSILPSIINEPHIVIIDCDSIKDRLPEYTLYECIDSLKAASLVHKESKHIAVRLMRECLSRGLSFIYDSTMSSPPGEFLHYIDWCKTFNFTLMIVGVYADLNTALQRAEKRFQETKRKVPEDTIRWTHKHFPITFFAIEDNFDVLQIYDNSVDGKAPTLVAERFEGQLEVFNSVLYNKFKKRGGR